MLFFLFGANCFAKVETYESLVSEKKEYTYSEVCKLLTGKDYPLISKVSVDQIDCMEKKFKAIDFCEKKEAGNPYLSRGVVKKKKVVCESSKRVTIRYRCENKADKFCKDQEIGCYLMKEKFAYRLQLDHGSLTDNLLKCFFTAKTFKKLEDL